MQWPHLTHISRNRDKTYFYVHEHCRLAHIHARKFFKYSFLTRFHNPHHQRLKKFTCQLRPFTNMWKQGKNAKARVEPVRWVSCWQRAEMAPGKQGLPPASASPANSPRFLGLRASLLPEAHLASRCFLSCQPRPSRERDEHGTDRPLSLLDRFGPQVCQGSESGQTGLCVEVHSSPRGRQKRAPASGEEEPAAKWKQRCHACDIDWGN